ncbi:pollen receptor-like kinase 3 [Rhodamnia argentea]|uniref:Pollen receptor-like kinase 3 n=1 Tax=Rhodamnia argentea TaxID=178133 RepID=A0A8B8PW07_9MYRT|nr:pollen receptor-like kinase 3 [Rhodamnia argentea]
MAFAAVPPIVLSLFIISFTTLALSAPEDALLQFKRSLGNADALDSWSPGSQPCNGWIGIICFDGIITGLHLSDMGFSGKIDIDALEALPGLRTLSFTNNLFTGPMPDFYRLGAIKSLLLSRNQFYGEIPRDFFQHMASLKKIWLSKNNFSGSIPESLMQLSNLMELHLEGNNFSGRIPVIKDEKLISLDLSDNKLEGEIPESLSKFNSKSFEGNPGLCGKPLDKVCPGKELPGTETISVKSPPPLNEHKSNEGFSIVLWIVAGLVAAVVLLAAIVSSRRRRDDDFSILGKEKVSEACQVPIPGSKPMRTESSKKGSVSKRKAQGSKHGLGNLVMLSDEKGEFGLADLMRASAEVLGNGGLGSAYKAVMSNGLSVVVKRMREMNALEKDQFDAEIRRFARLHHRNILTPLAYHYRRDEKLLVSEYIPKGSLLYILHGDRGIIHSELNWPTRLKIVQGIASGLAFLHSELASYDLPHGNLKSSNILLSSDYEPLLNDYGFHPLINPSQAAQTLFAYKAPEISQQRSISPKCDVYCLGLIILEVLTGKLPSQYINSGKSGTDVVMLVHSAISEEREAEVIDPEIAGSIESKSEMLRLLHIGAACTEKNPDHRLDLREATRKLEELQV